MYLILNESTGEYVGRVPNDTETLTAGLVFVASTPDREAVYAAQIAALPPPPIEPPAAIPPITPRQLRLWLIMHGVTLAQVDALIGSIPDPAQREAARITWEYSIEFDRPHPLIAQFGAALGFDSVAMDAAFREASQL